MIAKKQKSEIWIKISNAIGGVYSAQQVQKCYENIRQRAIEKDRKNVASPRQTGGGPPILINLKPYEELILSFVNKSEPLNNVLDSTNPQVSTICETHTQTMMATKRPKLDPGLSQSRSSQSNQSQPHSTDQSQFMYVLKTTVLCTQGLAEANRLDESELKDRLVKRYQKEIKNGLEFLSDEESN